MGNYLRFDGNNDSVLVAVDCGVSWFPKNTAWSMSMLVRINELTDFNNLLGSQYNQSGDGLDLIEFATNSNGGIELRTAVEGIPLDGTTQAQFVKTANGLISESIFNRITFTCDASNNVSIYLNDALVKSGSFLYHPGTRLATKTRIGAVLQEGGNGTDTYTGYSTSDISEVRVYNGKELSSSEVETLVAGGNITENLVAFYEFNDSVDATVTTNATTNIKATSATLNGEIGLSGSATLADTQGTYDGTIIGATWGSVSGELNITERGFTYSTTTTPTIYTGTKVPSSSGSGSFDEDITGLLPNTTYYVRAYARYYDESGVLQTEYGDNVEFTTATLYGRLKYHNGTEWVLYPRPLLGTTNQVTVTDNLNTTYTLSLPQDIHTGATPTFVSLLLSGLTASRLVATDGTKTLGSVADLTAWIAGTEGNLTVTDDGDGTVTLKSIGSIVNVTTLTDTDTLTVAQQGAIKCNKASAMTVNLPTAVGNAGLSYFISNVNTGTVTIDPNGAETIQGDATFDLYQDESLSIVADGANWIVR